MAGTNQTTQNVFRIRAILRFPHFSAKNEELVCRSGISIESNIPVDSKAVRFFLGEYEVPSELTLRTVHAPADSRGDAGTAVYRYRGRLRLTISKDYRLSNMGKRFVMMEVPFGEETPRVKLYSKWYYGKNTSALLDQAFSFPENNTTCFFLVQKKGLSFSVREYNRSDLRSERAKIFFAFLASRFWLFRKPVLLFEKKAERYEESASAVYERLLDLGYQNTFFILDDSYAFRDRIPEKYRRNLISKFSFRHYLAFFAAKTYIGTEAVVHLIGLRPLNKYLRYQLYRAKYNYVFLQHGVMYMISLDAEQRVFFRFGRKGVNTRIVVSSDLEAAHFMNQGGYARGELYITGLPKYDRNLANRNGDRIGIMLTWRPWEEALCRSDVTQTTYYRALERIVEAIPESCRKKIVLLAHPLFDEALAQTETPLDRYLLRGQKFDEVLSTLSILITDYSSISYDAFYRGVNIIFDWTEKEECVRQYGESAHLMLTEELAFGDVIYDSGQLSELLPKRYGSKQDIEHRFRYSKLVQYCDGRNTDRVVQAMHADGFIRKREKEQKTRGWVGRWFARKTAKIKRLRDAVSPELGRYHAMMEEPLEEKTFVLEAGQGKNIHGNMFALLQELERNPEWKDYRICFVVSDSTEDSARSKLARYAFTRAELIRINSEAYRRLLATAKYLATDNSFPAWYIKREGQVILNTWHGTPLKRLGRSNIAESTSIANIQKNYFMSDYALFPNEYTRDIFASDYMLDRFFHGTSVLADYPRNAFLTALSEKEQKELLAGLGIKDKRVYAYMPTWRGTGRSVDEKKQVAQVTGVLFELDQYLRDDEVLLVNLHFLVDNTIDYREFRHIRRFPATIETYELLGACDALITDYSSVFFDYAVTGRPVVIYAYDYRDYLSTRGMYFSMDELPFPITKTVRELMEVLRADQPDLPDGYQAFRERYCSHVQDGISEQIIRLMTAGNAGELLTGPISPDADQEDSGRNELIYRGSILSSSVQKMILEEVEKGNGTGGAKQTVLFSDAVGKKTSIFLAGLPDHVEFIRLLRMHFDSRREAFSYLRYRMTGKKNRTLENILKREEERQLKWLTPAETVNASTDRTDTGLLMERMKELADTKGYRSE